MSQKQPNDSKKALQWRDAFLNSDPGPSPTARTQPWPLEHRNIPSEIQSNTFPKAVSLFFQWCNFFSEKHTKWSLFSVSNLPMAQLCFISPASLCSHTLEAVTAQLPEKFLFCSCFAFFAWILVIFCKWKETAASQARKLCFSSSH